MYLCYYVYTVYVAPRAVRSLLYTLMSFTARHLAGVGSLGQHGINAGSASADPVPALIRRWCFLGMDVRRSSADCDVLTRGARVPQSVPLQLAGRRGSNPQPQHYEDRGGLDGRVQRFLLQNQPRLASFSAWFVTGGGGTVYGWFSTDVVKEFYDPTAFLTNGMKCLKCKILVPINLLHLLRNQLFGLTGIFCNHWLAKSLKILIILFINISLIKFD